MSESGTAEKTPLYEEHLAAGGRMVEFAGFGRFSIQASPKSIRLFVHGPASLTSPTWAKL